MKKSAAPFSHDYLKNLGITVLSILKARKTFVRIFPDFFAVVIHPQEH